MVFDSFYMEFLRELARKLLDIDLFPPAPPNVVVRFSHYFPQKNSGMAVDMSCLKKYMGLGFLGDLFPALRPVVSRYVVDDYGEARWVHANVLEGFGYTLHEFVFLLHGLPRPGVYCNYRHFDQRRIAVRVFEINLRSRI